MDSLKWMLNEIRAQVRCVRKQISGLPEEIQESMTNECFDILKPSLKPEIPLDIRKDYADTLKEIVQLESRIVKLKRKAEDLEKCMDAPDDIPPNLDRDGCVYWDSILERTMHHD